ncbi:MAG: M20/M25/M40 family metallo-hydrolase [Chloroflexi bacterium]|nr:M20/M25/M40 family metallo-hydrolase [Chloroflexota bacterium]MDA1239570.1 M20/M25/M40 family metallo-hydrolase [Chloroflexota bacterium]
MPERRPDRALGIDWPATTAEALDVFRAYLRIDTSNPPGNETPAARFLGGLLEAEGIPCEYIETAPGREAVHARVRGDGSAGALMLASHTDVVPVDLPFWTVPPFDAVVRDDRVYGRGAVDMKGTGVMHLFAIVLAKRLGLPLHRDLVFLAVPDEEVGSVNGMAWLVRERPDLFDVEFCLNEGASGVDTFDGVPARLFEVAISEKELSPLRLTVTGTPGHGSKPAADNPAVHLLRALQRLVEWDRGIAISPTGRAYLEALHEAGLLADLSDGEALRTALRSSPDLEAAFSNTLNVTVLEAGIKSNMIPARAEATIDCRLVAGESREAWLRAVTERIDDPRVHLEFVFPDEPEPLLSPWETPLVRVIREVVLEAFEDAIVVPTTAIVGTDNRFLRPLGIPAYGFIPCLLSQEERDGFHANDEFLTVANFKLGVELMFEVVRRTCT